MKGLEELNDLESKRRNLLRAAGLLDDNRQTMAQYRKQRDIHDYMASNKYCKGADYLKEVLSEQGHNLMRLAEMKMELDARKQKVEAEVIKGQIQARIVQPETDHTRGQ